MTHKIPHRCLALLSCAVACTSARADGDADRDLRAPVASRNLAPIYANLGVPVQGDAAGLAAGAWQASWRLHWASHSVRESAGGIALEFDGETRRHDLNLRAGIGRGFTLGINVPWIEHDGGSLDRIIDGWHDLWGLPEGPRPLQPRDSLVFAYDGAPGFALDAPASGLGDLELGLSWQFATVDDAEVAVFAQAKLDTGEAEDFTGSGDGAYAAGLRASAATCVSSRLSCHAQLGVVAVGDLAYAPDADTRTWFAGVSLAWALADSLTLVAQVDAQGKVYQGKPLGLNGDPIWGTLGLRWAPGNRWLVEAQFSEDLAVGTAPDVTFLLGVARRF